MKRHKVEIEGWLADNGAGRIDVSIGDRREELTEIEAEELAAALLDEIDRLANERKVAT